MTTKITVTFKVVDDDGRYQDTSHGTGLTEKGYQAVLDGLTLLPFGVDELEIRKVEGASDDGA